MVQGAEGGGFLNQPMRGLPKPPEGYETSRDLREGARVMKRSEVDQDANRETEKKDTERRVEFRVPVELDSLRNPFLAYNMDNLISIISDGKHGQFGGEGLNKKFITTLEIIRDQFRSTGILSEALLNNISNKQLRDGVRFTIRQENDAIKRANLANLGKQAVGKSVADVARKVEPVGEYPAYRSPDVSPPPGIIRRLFNRLGK